MAALFAPQPLRLSDAPTIVDTEGHAPLSPHVGRSSFAGLDEDPFAVLHAQISKPAPSSVHQYLLPAPRISERRSKSKPHCKSPTPCNAIINKSSSLLAAPRSPRRRRHHASHARAACGFPPRNPAAFDALSWISALDSTEAVDPWNIADLSQLPVEDDRASRLSGPIRRRKTSSSSRADAVRSLGLDAGARLKPESAPEPEPLVAPSRDVMCTPPPRLPSTSHIQFHNLMPVWSPRATF